MTKHFGEENREIVKEIVAVSEMSELMDSLQGWCLNCMLKAETEPAKQLLQAINDWAEEKPFLGE
jgi:hypothetical protein